MVSVLGLGPRCARLGKRDDLEEGRADVANWPLCPLLRMTRLRERQYGGGAVWDALVGRIGDDITASSATAARMRIP